MKTDLGRTPAFLCLFFCAAALASGPDRIVTVGVVPPPGAVEAGAAAVINLQLDIRSPYHINSSQPLEDYLIPTSVTLEPVPGLEVGNIIFPAARIKNTAISDEPMALYEGTVNIAVEIVPSASLAGGNVALKGIVLYQACDDFTCLPPETAPFAAQFSVSAGIPEKPERALLSPGPAVSLPEAPDPSPVIAGQADGAAGSSGPWNLDEASFPLLLLLVFAGGLALNLTPCVYPMIPITVSYFGGQAQGRKGSVIAHAALYVLGMAVTYSLLGVIAALTGGLLGAALQYPPVLIGIALVMVFLALSMFDVFELRMPAFLNRLAGGNRKGFAGTFLMGLTVGIVAAPCIGPFVFGLLTYVGNRGNAVLGFLLFFLLALGLGIPLLLLGIFSGSIRKLPRSGQWMLWVRKVFGFILLAMAVFFLKTLFVNPLVFPLALALILVLAGAYLAWIVPVAEVGRWFAWIRNIVGLGFFTAALFAAATGLHSYVETMIADKSPMPSIGSGAYESRAINWIPYSEEALDRASLEGKPVFIDFYADWCAPCKEIDRHTFTDPGVIQLSREFFMLKVDLTSAGDPVSEAMRQKYHVVGVPTLVFLRPDRGEIESLRVTGFEPPDVFLPRMRRAYEMSLMQSGG